MSQAFSDLPMAMHHPAALAALRVEQVHLGQTPADSEVVLPLYGLDEFVSIFREIRLLKAA